MNGSGIRWIQIDLETCSLLHTRSHFVHCLFRFQTLNDAMKSAQIPFERLLKVEFFWERIFKYCLYYFNYIIRKWVEWCGKIVFFFVIWCRCNQLTFNMIMRISFSSASQHSQSFRWAMYIVFAYMCLYTSWLARHRYSVILTLSQRNSMIAKVWAA